MKVYLARWICTEPDLNLDKVSAEAEKAASSGAEMVVFPESFLHGYRRSVAPPSARNVFTETSEAHPSTLYFFGSFSEERRNRMTVWKAGREIARYDKVHLFEPNGEKEIWSPGNCYAAVRTGEHVIGLLNCNDLRFPEQAMRLRLEAGCDAFVVVAWWPWRRDHVWRNLLRARAIENHAWMLGCCVAASEHPLENFAGAGNYVFNPWGEQIYTEDDNIYVLECNHERDALVDPLREAMDVGEIKIFEE